MNKTNKSILIPIVAALLIVGGIAAIYFVTRKNTPSVPQLTFTDQNLKIAKFDKSKDLCGVNESQSTVTLDTARRSNITWFNSTANFVSYQSDVVKEQKKDDVIKAFNEMLEKDKPYGYTSVTGQYFTTAQALFSYPNSKDASNCNTPQFALINITDSPEVKLNSVDNQKSVIYIGQTGNGLGVETIVKKGDTYIKIDTGTEKLKVDLYESIRFECSSKNKDNLIALNECIGNKLYSNVELKGELDTIIKNTMEKLKFEIKI